MLIFVGTFFLMNLNLAIIRTKFDEASKEVPAPETIKIKDNEVTHDLKKFKEWGIFINDGKEEINAN